jgi:hypothetical protein
VTLDPWVEAETDSPQPPGAWAALRGYLAGNTNAVLVVVIVAAMLLVDALLRSMGR